MTNPLYARLQATAQRLIAKFGQAGTITRVALSGPPNDPIETPEEYPCMLVVMDYDERQIDGTRIRQTDKLIYLATTGLTIEPTEADRITAAESFAIVNIKPLSPAGITLYYEIQARR